MQSHFLVFVCHSFDRTLHKEFIVILLETIFYRTFNSKRFLRLKKREKGKTVF